MPMIDAPRNAMPTGTVLTDDELWTICDLIQDWGWSFSLKADRAKVVKLAQKLQQYRVAAELDV